MSILNIHERQVFCSIEQAEALLAGLASPADRLWPWDRWPAMRFDRGLQVGAVGGHGMIRYRVAEVTDTRVVFEFSPSMGLNGTHCFELVDNGSVPGSVTFRHTIDASATGSMRVIWPLAVRPLHDALVEDALDGAEAAVDGRRVRRQPFSLRVRALQRVLAFVSRQKSR
jgi:hypothetical protein